MPDYLFEFPNATEGLDQGLITLSTQIPSIPIAFLVFLWGFVFFGGALIQAKRTGNMDVPMWMMVSLLTVDLVGLIMSLQAGIINPLIVSVVFGLTLLSAVWFFLSEGRFSS